MIDQGIAYCVDDGLVQLGILAAERELHALVHFLGYVTRETRHPLKGGADGHHAHRHRHLLQLAGDLVHMGQQSG